MHDRQMKTDRRNRCQLVVALLLLWGCLSGRANVYATNIKLNGSTNNAAIVPGRPVRISYILNEPATNVLVRLLSGATVVWSNSLAGTNRGKQFPGVGRHQPGGPKHRGGNLPNQHHGGGGGPSGLDQHHR